MSARSLTHAQGTVAFFHPFADGGGGGERVLWWVLHCGAIRSSIDQDNPAENLVAYQAVNSSPLFELKLMDAIKRSICTYRLQLNSLYVPIPPGVL
jgi:hypothetical protein